MKTYWDYEEKERSELAAETVTALLDVELMTAGVLKPKAPEYKEVPESPVGEKLLYYGIEGKGKYGSDEHLGICFKTAEEAQKFLEMNPLVRDYDYEIGSEFAFARPIANISMTTEKLYGAEAINEYRSQLTNRKAATDHNQKLKSDFTAALTKSENVTKRVWADWYSCTEERAELSRIIATYKDYLKITNGEHGMAIAFLAKAYPQERVSKAAEWFPNEIPIESPELAVQ